MLILLMLNDNVDINNIYNNDDNNICNNCKTQIVLYCTVSYCVNDF